MMADDPKLVDAYSAHARGYADAWSPVIRPLGRRMLAAVPWDGVRWILDVGTGTGALLPDLRTAAPRAAIIGVDPSPVMLQLARTHGTSLALMNALQLGIRAEAIDVVVMAFMLFHLETPEVALAEVRRVLAPGGRVGTVTWAEDPDLEATRVFEAELDAYGASDPIPIPASEYSRTNTAQKMKALFVEAGLEPDKVWIERFEHRWTLEGFLALRTTFGRTMRKLGSLDAPKREAFRIHVRGRLAALDASAFLYRAAVVSAVACRPR